MTGLRRDNIAIQTMHFPDRKKPALCIVEDNCTTVVGYFRDDKSSEDFWEVLDFIMDSGRIPERYKEKYL